MHDVRLIPIDTRMAKILKTGRAQFEAAYGASLGDHAEITADVVEQTLQNNSRRPREPIFGGYLAADEAAGTVVGTCGFRDGPSAGGDVELAYFTFPGFAGRGFATATAEAMIKIASQHPAVRRIIAHTLPKRDASPRVLEKVGMRLVGEVIDPEDGPVWEWEIAPRR